MGKLVPMLTLLGLALLLSACGQDSKPTNGKPLAVAEGWEAHAELMGETLKQEPLDAYDGPLLVALLTTNFHEAGLVPEDVEHISSFIATPSPSGETAVAEAYGFETTAAFSEALGGALADFGGVSNPTAEDFRAMDEAAAGVSDFMADLVGDFQAEGLSLMEFDWHWTDVAAGHYPQ